MSLTESSTLFPCSSLSSFCSILREEGSVPVIQSTQHQLRVREKLEGFLVILLSDYSWHIVRLRLLQRKLEVQVRRPTSVVVVASDEGENFSSTKFLALVEPVHARSCQVAVEGPDPTPVDDVLCDDHMSVVARRGVKSELVHMPVKEVADGSPYSSTNVDADMNVPYAIEVSDLADGLQQGVVHGRPHLVVPAHVHLALQRREHRPEGSSDV
mmetsp:Transcript_13905/g.32064  ORF Transcript_13905/g.32064 Transcript_13905/m.32064 type:complete len:213 (+) Transcript_13905:60-698(+)